MPRFGGLSRDICSRRILLQQVNRRDNTGHVTPFMGVFNGYIRRARRRGSLALVLRQFSVVTGFLRHDL